MQRPSHAAAALLSTVAAAFAQCPPGPRPPAEVTTMTTLPAEGPAAVRLRSGRDALAAGDAAAARLHLLAALEFHPAAPSILLEMVFASGGDAGMTLQWAERLVRAATDAKGRFDLPPEAKKRLAAAKELAAPLKSATELVALRSAAIAETARYVERHKASGKQNGAKAVRVRWAVDLLLALGEGAPLPLFAVAPGVAKVQDGFAPDYDVVYPALGKLLSKPLSKPPGSATSSAPVTGAAAPTATAEEQEARAVRAARILLGLQRQAKFDKLFGPAPQEIGNLADPAQDVLDAATEAAVGADKVWTVDELAALSPAEGDDFTQQHANWRRPGLAISPTGRYRIETVCGHQTLLSAARTIELHHERLVTFFGVDPFRDRPGIVRIVPEVSDLEAEGAPFWWAGGFQQGDRTVVRFAWGRIPALGRTLTHELTHRFQGVLRPFLGSWYGEGQADWTSGHYGRSAETEFAADYLRRGTVAHTYYKGYGDPEKFQQLLRGEIEDYRDNYFAGYSLYAFLRNYPPGQPRYREALPSYEKNARAGQKDPVGFFTATFCDGKQGRPKLFDELVADWQNFLRGCYERLDERTRNASNEWVERYTPKLADEAGSLVMDPPTWSWARTRAEPFFGQEHAAAATLLLHEVGAHEATIAAAVWSLAVDGWRRDICVCLLSALQATGAAEAAAAFAVIAGRHFPTLPVVDTAPLAAALPKVKQLLEALGRTGGDAPALVAEHARLASLVGVPGGVAASVAGIARHLGGHGYTEDGLTGYEERRHAGLWYATAEGDLHVGREKPREGTGSLDRTAHQRHAFVRTVEWFEAGEYIVRGRVHFTTSFVSGAIVLGHGRRDRSIRLGFSSGDFDYATGRRETKQGDSRISFSLEGLWERDGQLPESKRHSSADSVGEGAFDFAIHVRGPRVVVSINGEPLGRYSVHDGAPVEGAIGFAMNQGAVRVQQPVVQRLDGGLAIGLDLAKQPTVDLEGLLALPVRGLPLHPDGTFVLWLPPTVDDAAVKGLGRLLPGLGKLMTTPHEHPQNWLVAVPREMPAAERERVIAKVAEVRGSPPAVVEHAVKAPFGGEDPWVLFVDGEGLLRAASGAGDARLHVRVARWGRMFRRR